MTSPRTLVPAALAALATLLAAAATASTTVPTSAPTAARQSPVARYVVAITIDGLNPTALSRLGPTRSTGFTRMRRAGTSTLNARTAFERTETMPDHSSVFTGRRVTVSPAAHWVTFNDDSARTTIHAAADEYVSSMFDVVHDRGRRTLFFAGKEKFAFWNRSWDAAHGASDQVGTDNGRDKISRYREGSAAQMTDELVASLRNAPAALSYLHVPLPDLAGHASGFMSEDYLQAVERSGRIVARILDVVRSQDRLRGHTTVVLTADHGGGGLARSHSDPTLWRNYRIPFMVWGAGVARGTSLYRLNPSRRDPGNGRPGYAVAQPVRNLDLANLVTTLLGYPTVPGSAGTPVLQVS